MEGLSSKEKVLKVHDKARASWIPWDDDDEFGMCQIVDGVTDKVLGEAGPRAGSESVQEIEEAAWQNAAESLPQPAQVQLCPHGFDTGCFVCNSQPVEPLPVEAKEKAVICRHCDQPIRETHMGRVRNEWEHMNGLSYCADGKNYAWPVENDPLKLLARLLTEGGAIPVINGVRIEPKPTPPTVEPTCSHCGHALSPLGNCSNCEEPATVEADLDAPLKTNPFPVGSESWGIWLEGWENGRLAAKKAETR